MIKVMIKRAGIIVGVVIVFFLGWIIYTQRPSTVPVSQTKKISPAVTRSISVSPSPLAKLSFCSPKNLEAVVSLSAGAGNIYATVTIKNISKNPCQILGNQSIAAQYDIQTVKNITVVYVGKQQRDLFTLTPQQSIYSQIHYPNGPQCQSIGLNSTNVTFTYKISPDDTITFKNQDGKTAQIVQTCKDPTDMTEIEIWNIASEPIVM